MSQPEESSSEDKLRAVKVAAKHQFPTGNIDQLLSEIEQGYKDINRPDLKA